MRISRTDRCSTPCERGDVGFNGEVRQPPLVSLASKTVKLDTPRLPLLCFVLFFLTISPVRAFDASKQISQYGHTAWRIGDGDFSGTPNAIAQTTDGYLWIGTQAGLMRFDGVRFVLWHPPEGKELPSSRIISLLGGRDGSLWIGTSMGLACWRDGKLTNYGDATGSIMAILEDRAGTIWIARYVGAKFSDTNGPLCKVTDAGPRCYGKDDGLAIPYAATLANDRLGNIWLAGGLMVSRWNPNSADTYIPTGLNPAEIFNGILALAGRPDGSLWVGLVHAGKGGGLQQLSNGTWKPFVIPGFDGSSLKVTSLLLDQDSSLWVGTLNQGIYRIQGNKVDHFRGSDGLSGDAVTRFFQDREGNIWVSTSSGIDKFHDLRVATFSTRQGLSADQANSVLASRDGTVWIGNYNLDVLRSGKITSIRPETGLPGRAVTALLEDRAGRLWVGIDKELSVYEKGKFRKIEARDGGPLGAVRAMTQDVDGSIWVVTSGANEIHNRLFRIQDLRIREEISSPQLTATTTLASDPHGGVWIGFTRGGLARYRNGQAEFFAFSNGPNDGPVHGLLVSSDASVLAATPSGVVGWRNGRTQRLTVRNGLPCDVIYTLIFDKASTLWLYAACGLIAIPNSELQRWWESADVTVRSSLLDAFDGAQPMSTPFQPNASQSPDGRLWFANENVVQMIDPARLDGNPIPPPVRVEEIIADHKRYAPRNGLRLPAFTRDLEIHYTALSFVAPQKVRFRYKLEGQDKDWREVVNDRDVQYSNLAPGNYLFRVTACNNDRVWNEEGAFVDFAILPAYYQTNWFRTFSLAVLIALLWSAYWLRIQQLRREEKKLRDVVETMPTFAWTALSDGSVDFVNRHWHEYTGLSTERTVGSGWQEAVHPEDLRRHAEKWRVSLATGEPFESEVRYRRAAGGQYRWFLARAVPLRDPRGKILKWYGTSTDIEDRKRVEQLQSELAHVNRVTTMGELTASLAHEIKQPIAATITNAQTCLRWLKRDQPDVDEARQAAERIRKDGMRAGEIIDRIRSLSQKSTPKRELVEINEIVGGMVLLLRSEANQYAVSLRMDLAADLPKAMADRVQLQQIFMNLMLNGIEAMKEAGGILTVKTELGQGGPLLISVSDTGVGLLAENADQIFSAFFTTKPEGSGMGLAVSRSIVESHGGSLWATANDGRGATFHFTLPIVDEGPKAPATAT